jgi:hypothetical protein
VSSARRTRAVVRGSGLRPFRRARRSEPAPPKIPQANAIRGLCEAHASHKARTLQ